MEGLNKFFLFKNPIKIKFGGNILKKIKVTKGRQILFIGTEKEFEQLLKFNLVTSGEISPVPKDWSLNQ